MPQQPQYSFSGGAIIPQTVTSDVLKPQPNVQLPPPPPNDPTALTSHSAGGTAQVDANTATLTASNQPVQQPDPITAMMQQLTASSAPPPSLAELYNTDYASSGIDAAQADANAKAQKLADAQAKLSATSAKLAGINAAAQAIPIQDQQDATGRGITAGGVAPITAAHLRENALKAIPIQAEVLAIQAEVAAAQGNSNLAHAILQQATDHLDKMFQIHAADQKAQYDYKQNLLDKVYEFASKKEQNTLEDRRIQNERDYQTLQLNTKTAQELAKVAMTNGQGSLATQLASLDPKSPTFSKDLANLQGQIQMSPEQKLDIELKRAQLLKTQKETQLLGEPTATEKKATAAALKEAQASIPIMQDKITLVDTLTNHDGLNSRVGTTPVDRGLFAIKDKLFGAGQDFAGGVHNLVNGMTLQNLIDAKARGATFGALSEGELKLLASSATKINDWEIRDAKGNGTGYWNIDEASFKKELDNVKALTQRALLKSGQSLFSPDEQAILDQVDQPQFNAANYFKK